MRANATLLCFAVLVGCGGRTGLQVPADESPDPEPSGPAAAFTAAHLTAGLFHTCAVGGAGEVACWGFNTAGQLGSGTWRGSNRPVPVVGVDDAILASAGREHTCVLRMGGQVSCWGSNRYGQLGGAIDALHVNVPADLRDLGDVVGVTAGGQHACALTSDGAVACWGDESWGQLGRERPPATHRARFAHPDLPPVAHIAAGWLHTCALTVTRGRVVCWGWNAYGQLGRPGDAAEASPRPAPVIGLSDVTDVDAGDYHSCAVLSSGAVRCWGRNNHGQLGDGTRASSAEPVAVLGIGDAARISAGHEHTCVLRRSGEVACWGRGDRGQLGRGDEREYDTTPSRTDGLRDAVQISVGWRHGCARRAAGGILCWGRNVEGQLGTGAVAEERSPTPVLGEL